MTNFQVYRKILSFSLLEFLVSLLSLAAWGGLSVAGYFIGNTSPESALIGLAIGFLVGIIVVVLVNIFISNRIKAAQIAMMVKGVMEGQLPEHTFKAGFEEIRGRFAKITVFYFVSSAIKGIFRQLGRTINKIGTAIGGDTGNTITSVIDSAIQTLIGYLSDCCLGWILYRKDIGAAQAGCEGAVIFFKHGKTLLRNIGRIFGMGAASLILVAGAFFGLSYVIFLQFPTAFQSLAQTIIDLEASGEGEIAEFLKQPETLMLFVAAIVGIAMWSTIHGVFVRPFILVGVLRNFMKSGVENMPSESDFEELDKKSPKFRKLHNSI